MTVSTQDRTRPHPDPRSIANAMWPAAAVIAVQLVVYPVPVGVWLQGLVVGLLNAVVVLGIMLVYRANRVINLAQASVGAFPTALAAGVILFGAPGLVGTSVMAVPAGLTVGFVAYSVFRVDLRRAALAGLATAVAMAVLVQVGGRLGYVGGVLVGLVVAVLTGAGIDAVVVRRFRLSARLVLTVATIGLAQFYAVGALLAPRVWNHIHLTNGSRTSFGVPGGVRFAIGRTVFGGNEILAVVVSVIAIAVVATALRRTDIGVAVRAVADRSDRASMLGNPAARLECGVWVGAVVLAFVGTFLQSAMLGLQLSAGIGLRVLVAALAALALGGFATLAATLSAAGVDILDGQKNQFAIDVCGRSNVTFADAEGAFVANIDGPVRAIRSYVGANSGPLTERTHLMYRDRVDVTTDLRVHPIPGVLDFVDYSAAAIAMTYRSSTVPGGATIDGDADDVPTAPADWEAVDGPQGKVFTRSTVSTDAPGVEAGLQQFYRDQSAPPEQQCWGDGSFLGASGANVSTAIANTDPRNGAASTFISRRTTEFAGPAADPSQVSAQAAKWASNLATPLTTTVSTYQP